MIVKKKLEDGGELGDAPNDKWAKFFVQFKEIETLPNTQWKPVHLIGYFCKKYYEAYNVKYSFKFNNMNPNKSFELFQLKTLAINLSSNPGVLRDYIDWTFLEKVQKGRRRFTSISFMTKEEDIKYYKINVLLADKKNLHVDRSTALPTDYKETLKVVGPIGTYGDLSFMYQSFKSGAFDGALAVKFSTAMETLEKLGLDVELLNRIV